MAPVIGADLGGPGWPASLRRLSTGWTPPRPNFQRGSTSSASVGAQHGSAGYAILALHLQGDGRLLVGGDFTTFSGLARDNLVRMMDDGSVDPTFSVMGMPTMGDSDHERVRVIEETPDGALLVGGDWQKFDDGITGGLALLEDASAPTIVSGPTSVS